MPYPEQLSVILVPVPSLDAQQGFGALQAKARVIQQAQTAARRDLGQLMPAMLAEIFSESAEAEAA